MTACLVYGGRSANHLFGNVVEREVHRQTTIAHALTPHLVCTTAYEGLEGGMGGIRQSVKTVDLIYVWHIRRLSLRLQGLGRVRLIRLAGAAGADGLAEVASKRRITLQATWLVTIAFCGSGTFT